MHVDTRMQIQSWPRNLKSRDHVRHIEEDAKTILKMDLHETQSKDVN
jgi:hypothetical protein